MVEYWDLYDTNRNKTGQLHQRGLRLKDGQYHLVVAVWVKDKNNELLLTRRNPEKLWGNYWECTGGAVIAGEDSISAVKRELLEEIGVEVTQEQLKLLVTTKHRTWFTDTYLIEKNISLGDMKLQPEEVIDAKWVTINELETMCINNLIVPVVVEQFKHYKDKIFQV